MGASSHDNNLFRNLMNWLEPQVNVIARYVGTIDY